MELDVVKKKIVFDLLSVIFFQLKTLILLLTYQ